MQLSADLMRPNCSFEACLSGRLRSEELAKLPKATYVFVAEDP